jgi:glycosyltransferase involved in cell wall biosynthesis
MIDDGSTDSTVAMVSNYSTGDNRFKLHRLGQNLGKGAAIHYGLQRVAYPYVVIQDGDLEYNPIDFPSLLLPLLAGKADVVYGSRWLHPSRKYNNHLHRCGNWLLTYLTNLTTGLSLTDQATCYKMFPRSLISVLELRETGFGFCPEFTVKCGILGINITEVPISYCYRTRSEGKKIRVWHGVEAIACLLRYRKWKTNGKCFPIKSAG